MPQLRNSTPSSIPPSGIPDSAGPRSYGPGCRAWRPLGQRRQHAWERVSMETLGAQAIAEAKKTRRRAQTLKRHHRSIVMGLGHYSICQPIGRIADRHRPNSIPSYPWTITLIYEQPTVARSALLAHHERPRHLRREFRASQTLTGWWRYCHPSLRRLNGSLALMRFRRLSSCRDTY